MATCGPLTLRGRDLGRSSTPLEGCVHVDLVGGARAQIRVRKCGTSTVFTEIPRISYHKCGILPHHFLVFVGTTSV